MNIKKFFKTKCSQFQISDFYAYLLYSDWLEDTPFKLIRKHPGGEEFDANYESGQHMAKTAMMYG